MSTALAVYWGVCLGVPLVLFVLLYRSHNKLTEGLNHVQEDRSSRNRSPDRSRGAAGGTSAIRERPTIGHVGTASRTVDAPRVDPNEGTGTDSSYDHTGD